MGAERSASVTVESAVSWHVTSCILVYVYRRFRETATFLIRVDLCLIKCKRRRYSLEMKVHGPQSHSGGVMTKVVFSHPEI
jgi:hypothetical protein